MRKSTYIPMYRYYTQTPLIFFMPRKRLCQHINTFTPRIMHLSALNSNPIRFGVTYKDILHSPSVEVLA